MEIRSLTKNAKDTLISLLILMSSILISFFLVAFAKTSLNYRQTSSNYSQIGNDLMPNLGLKSLILIISIATVIFIIFQLVRKGILIGLFFYLYKHRFLIGILIIIVATVFKLSGSSITCMSAFLAENSSQGPLFGIPRTIRSDEWLVFTPFAFSQEATGYASVSDLLRGTATNVTLVYAQPCWNFSTLFRPFLWGYLVFGSVRGLAFFWSSRLVCLFLVSEKFAQMFFGKNRLVTTSFALMVTFSGTVQWWFAVNGTAELFIFGQLLVLCLEGLLKTRCSEKGHVAAYTLSIAWLCVAFILILYPAWQVVLFWVFLSLGISRIVSFINEGHDAADVIAQLKPLFISLIFAGAGVAVSFIPVIDVIQAVSETVYPGSRVINGGGFNSIQLGDWARSIFSPLAASAQSSYSYSSSFSTNVCESSVFFAPTPLGFLIALISCVRSLFNKRSVDPALCALCIVEVVLLIYCVVGLPAPIASITLLSHSGVTRCWEMIGYVDLILLVRWSSTACGSSETANKKMPIILMMGIVILSLVWSISAENVRLLFTIGSAIAMMCLLISIVLMRSHVTGSDLSFLTIAIFVAISGACINPLQSGAYTLTDGPTATAISQNNSDGDLWLADNSILGNLCIAEGASCVNSVNAYPALSTWHLVDQEGKYSDVYNRYAHITVEPTCAQTSFELMSPDSFQLIINLDDVRKIGVTKWISSNNLSDYNTDSTEAVEIGTAGKYKIWQLVEIN